MRSVKFQGQKYTIKKGKKKDPDKEELSGECCQKEKTIYIYHNDDTPRELFNTYIHEFLHGVQFESGLAEILSDDAQELVCHIVSHFFTDNWEALIGLEKNCKNKFIKPKKPKV